MSLALCLKDLNDLTLALTLAALTVSLWVNKIACRALMLTFQFIALTELWTVDTSRETG